ncbi:conserved hypothetical protein [Phenylobacterium zucineum HLK1]|uniref:Uncharacterized protein n=1 Tax=Phenylobacterium zucineum (strain HLK1) TaxID=450851 RepID=B4RCY9_PHEZH|nr:hypothetical protein [Phenylobacterium zucineum]ACG79921.1 conserved hypothetical protein [Phenylobacterium zucineum HLK1]
MDRRAFLAAAAALPFAGPVRAAQPPRTRWDIGSSTGFDALAFLGPLSGKPLYAERYRAELDAFAPRSTPVLTAALGRLQARADAEGKLLWPTLANVLSYGPAESIDELLASLSDLEGRILPAYRASSHWDEASWRFVAGGRADVAAVLGELRAADFPSFRAEFVGDRLSIQRPRLAAGLAGYDVIAEQERLIGRRLDPVIGVVLLWFSKPHGVSVGGQRSLSHFDYPLDTVVRVAAHEMLHPPFPMDGPAATAALKVLAADPLMVRVLKEHDPGFGYNSMDGLLNEDTVQALDQIVSERLGVARDPAERWRTADDGMHVLAAALYGMLKAEGYDRTGGDIEAWMEAAARGGKLAPERIARFAGQVTATPPDRLWPRRA